MADLRSRRGHAERVVALSQTGGESPAGGENCGDRHGRHECRQQMDLREPRLVDQPPSIMVIGPVPRDVVKVLTPAIIQKLAAAPNGLTRSKLATGAMGATTER